MTTNAVFVGFGGVSPVFHPEIVPFSFAKMNLAGADTFLGVIMKLWLPLKTTPVGFPGTSMIGCGRSPSPFHLKLTPVSVALTHHGPDGPRARPQAFTRFTSFEWSAGTPP